MKKASARRTLRIGIASVEAMKARSMAIARGEVKPASDEPKIWFPSAESLGKVSNKNRELLARIRDARPQSLQAFSELTGREVSNPFAHAQDHGAYGLVALKRGPRGRSGRKCPTRRSTCAPASRRRGVAAGRSRARHARQHRRGRRCATPATFADGQRAEVDVGGPRARSRSARPRRSRPNVLKQLRRTAKLQSMNAPRATDRARCSRRPFFSASTAIAECPATAVQRRRWRWIIERTRFIERTAPMNSDQNNRGLETIPFQIVNRSGPMRACTYGFRASFRTRRPPSTSVRTI